MALHSFTMTYKANPLDIEVHQISLARGDEPLMQVFAKGKRPADPEDEFAKDSPGRDLPDGYWTGDTMTGLWIASFQNAGWADVTKAKVLQVFQEVTETAIKGRYEDQP